MNKSNTFLKGKALQTDPEPERKEKKEISIEEACEFLWFIQQSEHKVVGIVDALHFPQKIIEENSEWSSYRTGHLFEPILRDC